MNQKTSIKDLKIMWKYLKTRKATLILYIILLLVNMIPQIAYGLLWGLTLQALVSKNMELFITMLLLLEGMNIFLSDILYIVRMRLYKTLEITFIKNVTKDLYHKMNCLPSEAFEKMGVGEFINRLSYDPEQIMSLLNQIIELFARGFVAIFAVVFAFSISLLLGIEIVIFGLIMGISSYIVYPKIKQKQKEINQERDQYVKKATENLSGIREIKALNIKKNTEKQLYKSIDYMFSHIKKSDNYKVNYRGLLGILYELLQFVIFLTCGYYFIQGHIVYSTFIMIENYLWRVDYVVSSLSELIINYNKVMVSIQRMNEILNNKLYADEKFGSVEVKDPVGVINFQNVYFKYYDEEKNILNGITMNLRPNQKIAIVGKSGNGKSTIFNLLLRYFDVTKGKILIDGIPIEDISEKSLRQMISIIRQDPFLFNRTLLENFQLVKPDVTLEEVRKVCKKAYIDDYIMSLPKQYDTMIGEGGINLSGGQKQRIAIARTLLLNTKIILFDEATSALDNESQNYIKKTMDELVKNHAVLIIAHRLSTIVDADEIHVIHKGKEIACGKHEELMEICSVYQTLYTSEQ